MRRMKYFTYGLGSLVVGLALAASDVRATGFTLEDVTGEDSQVTGTVVPGSGDYAGSLLFELWITKPSGPSASDLSGFFLHVADENLIGGFSVSEVKFGYNGTLGAANDNYSFVQGPANAVVRAGSNNNNMEGTDYAFDLGFEFGAKNGLDSPGINGVQFVLSHSDDLDTSLIDFDGQLFGARLQPLNGEYSAKLIGHLDTDDDSPQPVPDAGGSLVLLGLALLGIGGFRKFSA